MKIEIGKEYLTREGKRVRVERLWASFPFEASNGVEYTVDGMEHLSGESPRDLIAEIGHDDETCELVIKVPPCTRYRVEVQEREYGDPDLHNKIEREGGYERSGLYADMKRERVKK